MAFRFLTTNSFLRERFAPNSFARWNSLSLLLHFIGYFWEKKNCQSKHWARVDVLELSIELEAMCHQAERDASGVQMADPAREEEQVTLLGEEGLRAGGQALKLG